jgi:hypothetical protein
LALLQSDLNYQVEAALRRAGIDIPFPQRTLHVSAEDVGAILERVSGADRAPAVALYDSSGMPASLHHVAAAPEALAPGGSPVAPAPPRALGLDTLVMHMRGPSGLAIEDRRYRLTVYPKCFVGSEAVAWLMRTHELTREEAIRLGQSLVDRGVIHHVLDEHPFRDGQYFYRFYADEAS